MELLINGDIYIKIEPDEKQELEDKLYDLTFEEAQNGISEETEEIRAKLEYDLEELKNEKYNYEHTENFYILSITQTGIELICYDNYGHKIINKCNIEELKQKYIRLVDFLRNAKYIGKIFVRTEPIMIDECIDKSYMNQEPYETITTLYQTDYAMLANYKTSNGNYFEMINPQYLIDKKYTFIGNKNIMYEDKKETYFEVINQIEKKYQYYKKYYEK